MNRHFVQHRDIFIKPINTILETNGSTREHELTLEDSRYFDPEMQSNIVCLNGARACPSEDVGGATGILNSAKKRCTTRIMTITKDW